MNAPRENGPDPLETLALGALIALGVAGGGHWLAASLAALVGRQRSLDAGLGESIGALRKIPDNWTDPRRAWPEPASSNLPGALLYWLSVAVVLAAGAGALLLWLKYRLAPTRADRPSSSSRRRRAAQVGNDEGPRAAPRPRASCRSARTRSMGQATADDGGRFVPRSTRCARRRTPLRSEPVRKDDSTDRERQRMDGTSRRLVGEDRSDARHHRTPNCGRRGEGVRPDRDQRHAVRHVEPAPGGEVVARRPRRSAAARPRRRRGRTVRPVLARPGRAAHRRDALDGGEH